jgi:hypothetical protein
MGSTGSPLLPEGFDYQVLCTWGDKLGSTGPLGPETFGFNNDLTVFFPIDVKSIRAADDLIAERAFALGRMSVREKAVALVMLGTLAGWILGGEEFGLASWPSIAMVVVFALGLVAGGTSRYVSWHPPHVRRDRAGP